MKELKLRTYIDKTGNKAKKDLLEFYNKTLELIESESKSIPDDINFINLNLSAKKENREITKLNIFYKGAVLPYYIRQREEKFDSEWKITNTLIEKYEIELKKKIGFFKYNEKGEVDGLNEFKVFEETKAYAKTINDIENICFSDQGFIFPVSKDFKNDVKMFGADAAKRIAAKKLQVNYNNKFNQNEYNK